MPSHAGSCDITGVALGAMFRDAVAVEGDLLGARIIDADGALVRAKRCARWHACEGDKVGELVCIDAVSGELVGVMLWRAVGDAVGVSVESSVTRSVVDSEHPCVPFIVQQSNTQSA